MRDPDTLLEVACTSAENVVYDLTKNIDVNMKSLKNAIKELEDLDEYSYKNEVISEISNILCEVIELELGGLTLAYYHEQLT